MPFGVSDGEPAHKGQSASLPHAKVLNRGNRTLFQELSTNRKFFFVPRAGREGFLLQPISASRFSEFDRFVIGGSHVGCLQGFKGL